MTKIYLVFGKQGSGKTTQGKWLAEKLNLPYFEAGDALRKMARSGTEEGIKIGEIMASGNLVPDESIQYVFGQFIKADETATTGFATDGFPRTLAQAQLIKKYAEKYSWQVIGINIDISDKTAMDRLSKRVTMVDGKPTVRADDTPEAITKRLKAYQDNTMPVINWVKENYQLIDIDGEPPIEEVSKDVEKIINAH
jgi:adenylate kinase